LIDEGSQVREHVGGDLAVLFGKRFAEIIILRLGPARELGTIFYSFGNHCTGHHDMVGRGAMSARENVALRVSNLLAMDKLKRMNEGEEKS